MSTYLERLKGALLTNSVVTIVGAGVSSALSKNAPEADWVGLVASGIDRVHENDPSAERWAAMQRKALSLAADDGDTAGLIGVAGQVTGRLTQDGPQPFADWLRDTVGSLKVRDPRLAKAIGDLRTPILTTNYDELLEDALHRNTINWTDREEMRAIFRAESNAVGHLHGDWKHPTSIILSPEQYALLSAQDPAQALESAHFTSKSFLFIGYGSGLNDPNFSKLVQWHRKLFPESRGDHFRLCLESEYEALVSSHANDDIRVVTYGQSFDELPGFLDSLRPPQGNKAFKALGRDAVAYAHEAIIDQIRSETVVGDRVQDIDEKELGDITVKPVLLPMPHEQFVNARAVEGDLRPERINSHSIYRDDKVLILAGEELSGVTTALRWIVANAAVTRNRTAPIFVDARNCTLTARPLDRQVRTEAFRHRLILGKKDQLPEYVLAIDNLKPQSTQAYQNLLDEIGLSQSSFIVIGCREGDEGQIVEDLRGISKPIEIAYVGKLGRGEVEQFARILAPNVSSAICDRVLEVVKTERLPRTPFTVALLVVLLAQGSGTNAINNSETAVLEQYVNLLLGRSGPYLDPRQYLDPQNREAVLSHLAKEFVRARRGAITEGEAVTLIEKYFESRDWAESANAALDNFRRMRLLRLDGNAVQFQQTSYLHLFAAKAAIRDQAFLEELLEDPLYFSPIIRHYAALVRNSEEVVLRMKDLLLPWETDFSPGRFYGPVRTVEVEDAGEEPADDEAEAVESTTQETQTGDRDAVRQTTNSSAEPEDEEYDESSDADRVPFPLDDPTVWPESSRLSASLELASRVLRDSDDLPNLELKADLFEMVLRRWGYLAQLLEQGRVFDDLSAEITELFIREGVLPEQERDYFRDHFNLAFLGFTLYSSIISTLASRKLIRTYERVREEPGIRDDPHAALMLVLFALNVRGPGWTQELLALMENHGARWSTVQFVRMITRRIWRTNTLTQQDVVALRQFLRDGWAARFKFPNERTKKIRLKVLDQRLTKDRADGLAGVPENPIRRIKR